MTQIKNEKYELNNTIYNYFCSDKKIHLTFLDYINL